jgi:hypothetical protein
MNRPCKAHKTNGDPCKAQAMKGQNVCRVHGGMAPQNLAAAKRRMLEAVEPAIAELIRLTREAKTEGDRIKAIVQVLDRVGWTAEERLEDGETEVVIKWRG